MFLGWIWTSPFYWNRITWTCKIFQLIWLVSTHYEKNYNIEYLELNFSLVFLDRKLFVPNVRNLKSIRPSNKNKALGLTFRPTDKYRNSFPGLFVRRKGNSFATHSFGMSEFECALFIKVWAWVNFCPHKREAIHLLLHLWTLFDAFDIRFSLELKANLIWLDFIFWEVMIANKWLNWILKK